MATVAHYVNRWLELSAGFVASQIGLSRHRGVVISRHGWKNLDAFPYTPRYSLHRLCPPGRLEPFGRHAQLIPLLALWRAELVHVHFGYSANDVVHVTGPRRPYVLSLHGQDVTGLVPQMPDHYHGVTDAVDAVIVPSRFLRDAAIRAGFDPRAISVIPSGVDTSFFTPSPLPTSPPIVVFVGRLVEVKGVDVLLKAWPAIRGEVPDATLIVLGDGELVHLLASTDESVSYLRPEPWRRHEQVRELLRRASLVVSPSRTAPPGVQESLGLVNLEAGASARPVVSTRYGGIPEYVADGQTGLLVPENDPAALAEAIARILRDRSLAQRLASAATAQVGQWDVRISGARVDELYDELLARRARR